MAAISEEENEFVCYLRFIFFIFILRDTKLSYQSVVYIVVIVYGVTVFFFFLKFFIKILIAESIRMGIKNCVFYCFK